MRLLRAILALVLALAGQTVLSHLWPGAHRFVDLMLIPVVWYGLTGSQRSGMLVGCSSGLLQDAWFQITVFGLNGFKKTLLGWLLGGVGSRFDLNHQAGRFAAGFLFSLGDVLLDLGLRRLLDQQQAAPRLWEIGVKALVSGLLVMLVFGIVESSQRRRRMRRLAY